MSALPQNHAQRIKPLRLRPANRIKVLLCYLVCFAVPLLWQWAALRVLYPYKLANTAPSIAETLCALLPWVKGSLPEMAKAARLPDQSDPARWAEALRSRDEHWLLFLGVCFLAAFGLTLLIQLWWRFRHRKGVNASRMADKARRSYRLTMPVILAANAVFALFVYLAGVQHIPARTVWDYLAYFPAYGLNVLAAMACFRLAAPSVISGKHAFFKRL